MSASSANNRKGELWRQGIGLLAGTLLVFALLPWVWPSNSMFPWITDVVRAAAGDYLFDLGNAIGLSFLRFVSALLIGLVMGVLIGVCAASFPRTRPFFAPWLTIARVTPAIVWLPVFYTVPCIASGMIPSLLGVVFCSAYVAMEVERHLTTVHEDERTYLSGQKASLQFRMRYSYLPRLVAGIGAAMRLGGSVALILVVVGEAILQTEMSLGGLLVSFITTNALPALWATVIAIGSLALLVFAVFSSVAQLAGAEG